MLKKRIIPCLDIKEGRTVKGVNFEGLRDAGDPVELAKLYSESGADELVFLDITATIEKRDTLVELVKRVAEQVNIPFTIGGGINEISDAEILNQIESVCFNRIDQLELSGQQKHILTHQLIQARFWTVHCKSAIVFNDPKVFWVNLSDIQNYPVSVLIEKFLVCL